MIILGSKAFLSRAKVEISRKHSLHPPSPNWRDCLSGICSSETRLQPGYFLAFPSAMFLPLR